MSRDVCYGMTNPDWLINLLAAQLLPGIPLLFKRTGCGLHASGLGLFDVHEDQRDRAG